MRNAMPNEVGGILRRMVGANEVAERIKSVKFKEQRRRTVKEHAFLRLEDAILVLYFVCVWRICLLENGREIEFIKQVEWYR